MNNSIYKFSLDIHETLSQVVIELKQNDTAREFLISLTENGRPYVISENCYAVFTAKKPDGKIIYNECVIDGNVIRYTTTPQSTSTLGESFCEIKLYGENDALLTSPAFSMLVYAPVYQDGDVTESSNEYSALANTYAKTNLLYDELTEKLKNGELKGEDGETGESAYEIAVKNGFEGTEKEWLESLKGESGLAEIEDGSISTDKLADKAVAAEKLQHNIITSQHLKDYSVTTSKIGFEAVNSYKLAKKSVTSEKIDVDAVTTGAIKDGAVATNKIADGAVTAGKLAEKYATEEFVVKEIPKKQIQSNYAQNDQSKADYVKHRLAHEPSYFDDIFVTNVFDENNYIDMELSVDANEWLPQKNFLLWISDLPGDVGAVKEELEVLLVSGLQYGEPTRELVKTETGNNSLLANGFSSSGKHGFGCFIIAPEDVGTEIITKNTVGNTWYYKTVFPRDGIYVFYEVPSDATISGVGFRREPYTIDLKFLPSEACEYQTFDLKENPQPLTTVTKRAPSIYGTQMAFVKFKENILNEFKISNLKGITSADNGKFLMVVEGKIAPVAIPNIVEEVF